jgi:hypothetical protein
MTKYYSTIAESATKMNVVRRVHWFIKKSTHLPKHTTRTFFLNPLLIKSVTDWDRRILRTVQLKCGGTRWRTAGEVKGKLANGVGSQYSSHYLGTWFIKHYYHYCEHTSAASIRLNWRPPRRFKWTRPFRRKTKSGFCACAITFQTQSTIKRQVNWIGHI